MAAHLTPAHVIERAKRLKELGYSTRKAAVEMNVSRRSVERYWAIAYGGGPSTKAKAAVRESAFPGVDEYTWIRCRVCKAQVVEGWAHLHDTDCVHYRDDRADHPRPVW
jgi:hypothetical protein